MNGQPVIFILLHGTMACFTTPFHSYDYNTNITYILSKFSSFFFFRQNINRKVVLVVQGWPRSEIGENRWDEVFWSFRTLIICPALVLCLNHQTERHLNKQKPLIMTYCTFVKGIKRAKLYSSPKNLRSTKTKKETFIKFELISTSISVGCIHSWEMSFRQRRN